MNKTKPSQRLKFKVFDKNGKDVTDKELWLISPGGALCREITDAAMPVEVVDESEEYSVLFTYPDGDIIPFIN